MATKPKKPKLTKSQKEARRKKAQANERARRQKASLFASKKRKIQYVPTPIYLIGPSDCRVTGAGFISNTERPAHGSLEIGSIYEK